MSRFREPHSLCLLALTALLIVGSGVSLRLRDTAVLAHSEIEKPWDGTCVDYIISPYDSLMKIYADSVGLDWRLVSAVAYHESGFDTSAVSHRGAAGLMQMMPSTAADLGIDPFDPVQSVRAATIYLRQLHRNYSGLAADAEEQQKFMLAAYNAGTGRVRDCINYARYMGVDPSVWDNVAALIPEMDSDEVAQLDTVKFGRFNGAETVAYVQNVMDRYGKYKRRAR